MATEEKSLKKILDGILKTDMVVEEGTSGIWTYRKWSNGTAECWGKHTAVISVTATWGTGLYTGGAFTESYPSGLFIATPYIFTTTEGNSTYASWLYTQSIGTKDVTPQLVFCRGTSDGGSKTYTANLYAIGQWATVDSSSSTLNITGFSQNQMSKAEIRALIEASGNIFVDNTNWVPSDLQ